MPRGQMAEVIIYENGCDVVKTRFRAGILLLAFLSVVGIGVGYGSRVLDNTLAVLILSLYIVGSAALVLNMLVFRPEDRQRVFSCGELALLPESWRRWLLDEKERPARR
jgi:hypothetical protein